MGIKGNKNNKINMREAFSRMQKVIEENVLSAYKTVGETCLTKIRDRAKGKPNWTDQTGNLRSSVGYMIFVDGEMIFAAGFDPKVGADPSKGVDVGREYAKRIGVELGDARYALVVVAGMNYASYLEKKDYEVITFTEVEARIQADRLIKQMVE